jgi:hypothetical protein
MTSYSHPAIEAANCHGLLSIDGVLLNRDCMAVLNVMELWKPPPTRGANLDIPFLPGTLPIPRITHEAKRNLHLLVVGTCDLTGAPNPDPYIGLEENMEWLSDNIFALRTTAEAEVLMPSGNIKSGPVQVESDTLEWGVEIGIAITATFDITIPAGYLATTPAGS